MAERARPWWRDPTILSTAVVMLGVVVAVGAVLYTEYGHASYGEPDRNADGVPVTLPDGSPLPPVPAAAAAPFNEPVVAAPQPEEVPELPGCQNLVEWTAEPAVRAANVTPEGLTIALRGEAADRERLTNLICHARWYGDGWRVWATWSGGASDEETLTGVIEAVCCLAEGVALAGMETAAPDGAVWSAQRRAGYWLVYNVGEGGLVHPVWPARAEEATEASAFLPELVHVDRDGEPIAAHADTEGG